METKNKIIENQKGGNECNIKYFDIRDKKAIGHFEKDILLFNETNNDNKNKEPTNRYKGENISYSTDYMVDLLKVSEKIKPKVKKNNTNDLGTIEEIEIMESDESDIIKNNNSIFMKKKYE